MNLNVVEEVYDWGYNKLMTPVVQLFATCIIDTLYPEIGQAVVNVLERAGMRVEFPQGQTCCGQPAFNAGQWHQARPLALYNIRVFEKVAGFVVVPSGSCTAMILGDPAPIDYTLLVEVIKSAGVYANCDPGNFTDQESQHAGIRAMFPLTNGNCHVKLNPARYDLPKALALTKELGYKGLYAIEAGVNMGPDPYENTKKILDVILANI